MPKNDQDDERKAETPPPSSPITVAKDPLELDDGMDNVAARTEALAISSTFKLRGRGRTPSVSSHGNV